MNTFEPLDQFEFVVTSAPSKSKISSGVIRLHNRKGNPTLTIPADYSRLLWGEGFRSAKLAENKLTGELAIVFVKTEDGARMSPNINRNRNVKISSINIHGYDFLNYIFKRYGIKEGECRDLRLEKNRSVRNDVIFQCLSEIKSEE